MSALRNTSSCKPCQLRNSANAARLSVKLVPAPTPVGSLTPAQQAKLEDTAHQLQQRYLHGSESMVAQPLSGGGGAHAELPLNNNAAGLLTALQAHGNAYTLQATYLKDQNSNALCAEISTQALQHALTSGQAVKVTAPLGSGEFHFSTQGNRLRVMQFQET